MRPNSLQKIPFLLLAGMILCGVNEGKFVIPRSQQNIHNQKIIEIGNNVISAKQWSNVQRTSIKQKTYIIWYSCIGISECGAVIKRSFTPFLFIPTFLIPLPPLIMPFLSLAKYYYPIVSFCKLCDIACWRDAMKTVFILFSRMRNVK